MSPSIPPWRLGLGLGLGLGLHDAALSNELCARLALRGVSAKPPLHCG